MTTALISATRDLLTPYDLTLDRLTELLEMACCHQIEYADLYFERRATESWMLEESLLKSSHFDLDQGVGIRAVTGDKSGFAYSADMAWATLQEAMQAARGIAPQGGTYALTPSHALEMPASLYTTCDPLQTLTDTDKVSLLQAIDQYTRKKNPLVKEVIVSLVGSHTTLLVTASDGTLAADQRPLVRLTVTVILERSGQVETASFGGGGRFGYDILQDSEKWQHYADEAVRLALLKLDAQPAPAGPMTVVLGPGWPGVLLHEAVGHGLEGDFNRKGTSAFTDRIGELVASPLCTIVDDGTLPDRRGSLNIDDEGTPTNQTVLIEHGILKGYIQDKLNARLMNVCSTGNGRRESYRHLPMPRMTNTYMLAGDSSPDEILKSVERGLYATSFGGGQVDITSGKFVFDASEAYWIENGQVMYPVKGATLIGNGPDILHKVSMVGHDLALDEGVGTCGKQGQSVPVCVGQPTLKIDEITVGGTSV